MQLHDKGHPWIIIKTHHKAWIINIPLPKKTKKTTIIKNLANETLFSWLRQQIKQS